MKLTRVTVAAVGTSSWVPINVQPYSFGVGLGVAPWSTATGLTYTVQHSFDPPIQRPVSLVQTASTTVTVTDTGLDGLGHGLTTGDSVIIKGSGSAVTDSPVSASSPNTGAGDVGWTVTVVNNTSYTYTAGSSQTYASNNAQLTSFRVWPHATLAAVSARLDGNYAFPPRMVRLNVTAITGGAVDLLVSQASN